MAEWIISGNPKKFDLIKAFKDLGKIDWRQSTNIQKGDIVYIYVSEGYQSIKYKCLVNKVNLDHIEIDDSKYYLSQELDRNYNNYMELELIEAFETNLFDRFKLEKHDFISPQGPLKASANVLQYLNIVQDLLHSNEMDPDKHDGSYELIRETILSYKNMGNLALVDDKDLNLLYHLVIGSWRQSFDKKKESIFKSHLPEEEKQRLVQVLDSVWEKAKNGFYTNKEGDEVSVGMFGTGFYSFKTNKEDVSKFIKLCVDLIDEQDDNKIFEISDSILKNGIMGMKSASASVILHCLKPFVFPIFNSNAGNRDIFEYLGVEIEKKELLENYINNCRKVKTFRDNNFKFKNYRILDMEARNLGSYFDKFDNIDFNAIVSFFKNYAGKHYIKPEKAGNEKEIMENFRKEGKSACNEFTKFCNYVRSGLPLDLECQKSSNWINLAQITQKYIFVEIKNKKWKEYPHSLAISINDKSETGEEWVISVSVMTRDDNCEKEDYIRHNAIADLTLPEGSNACFVSVDKNGKSKIVGGGQKEAVKLRNNEEIRNITIKKEISKPYKSELTSKIIKETQEAVMELLPFYNYIFEKSEQNNNVSNNKLSLNTILYGPPGTGKTYNTVNYAVAICEGKSLEEIKNDNYQDVLKRYKELKGSGRIAFTTFHQSYGYEEFIEGIKPVLNEESNDSNVSELKYTLEKGIFRSFCENISEKASLVALNNRKNYGFNDNPTVWKVSLFKSYDNPIREECLKNGHIRIGWEEYGPDISDEIKYEIGGKSTLNAFINLMQIGDIVFSCYNQTMIDAIGVITGDYEWDSSFKDHNRVRKVNWIIKDKIDIKELNGNKIMVQSTVYRMSITVSDVKRLLTEKYPENFDENNQTKADPYVFIIDEINRGNISKIFGELITLIEDKKRLGNSEEMETILPYSHKLFGVPNNLYIIGTMNTSDRSIASIDIALRRRFTFKEMMPDSELVADFGIEFNKKFEELNNRIRILLDRDHQIGHSYFIKTKYNNENNNNNIKTLKEIWFNCIMPLLNEYFYNDWEKLRALLGEAKDPVENKDNNDNNDKNKKIWPSFIKKTEETTFAIEYEIDKDEQFDFVSDTEIDFEKALENAFTKKTS